MMEKRGAALAAMATTMGTLAAYVGIIRPWAKRWGATSAEVAMELPGDAIVARADYVATRAITIDARPDYVWPWLVQIGSGRAGWYSYDRLDNGGVQSADNILPAFQHLEIDDLVPMIPGTDVGVWVKELEPGRRMLWWDRKGEYSWEWLLSPLDAHRTRLISRLRATYPPLLSTRTIYALVATTGDIVMMRRCLLGIRRRAERHARVSGTERNEGATSSMEGTA